MQINNKVETGGWINLERHAPWLVLAISLVCTGLLWQYAHHASIQEQQIEFHSRVRHLEDCIVRRIIYYEQVLHGVRGFYLNQNKMEPHEFAGYIEALGIERNFPGIQGISFAPLISDAQKMAHIKAMRDSGLADYTIKPEGKRPSYAPVTLIEPFNERNARVLGFDNLSNMARKETIEKARDEGIAVVSEKLVLKQDDGHAAQAGFLMFLPAYRRNSAHDTLVARRSNIEGWFAASFRMDDLMASTLDEHSKGLGIEIFDEGITTEQSQMYGLPVGARQRIFPRYEEVVPVEFGGRKWTIQIFSLPEFENKRDMTAEYEAAGTGALLSLLLPLIIWQFARGRRRVVHMASAVDHESRMRKHAENKTRDLHMFNEAILASSPSGIAVFMASGPCMMANEAYAKLIGGTVEEVLKQDFRHNASWRRNGLLDFANQAFEAGESIRRDVEGMTSFGKKVVLECIFSPISVSEVPHLLVIVNDVSDRAAAEHALNETMRKLEEKELAKTRFLAAAGHDLRQPLAAANLFVDALKLTKMTIHQDEIIKRIDQAMLTFNGLLDALLNVSKLDAGMIKPEYSSIHVTELFNWLEQNFAPMATEKNLGFRLYFPMKEVLVIRSDIGLLKSILMNLVSNALKFTASGAILVSARRRGESVLIQIWDTGMGIPDEYSKHIFDEFYQINNPHRDRTSGLGLGLSIVKRALSLLGGEITCRSQVGRGSVFEFRLPLEDVSGVAKRQDVVVVSQKEVANESFTQGKRFVVVEDDVLVAQAMTGWLEGMGGEVICFHSTDEALRHANIEYADYFIVDYMLSGKLNGIQFLNLIHQKLGRPINAVLVTGDTSAAFIRNAVDCDWPVLHKPINTAKLISTLGAGNNKPK